MLPMRVSSQWVAAVVMWGVLRTLEGIQLGAVAVGSLSPMLQDKQVLCGNDAMCVVFMWNPVMTKAI